MKTLRTLVKTVCCWLLFLASTVVLDAQDFRNSPDCIPSPAMAASWVDVTYFNSVSARRLVGTPFHGSHELVLSQSMQPSGLIRAKSVRITVQGDRYLSRLGFVISPYCSDLNACEMKATVRFSSGETYPLEWDKRSFTFGQDICGDFLPNRTNFVDIQTTADGFYLSKISGLLWNGFVSPPPTTPTVAIKAIEITQGIQNLNHDVKLIAGKETWVRVHVSGDGTPITNLELYATDENGTPWAGNPIKAINLPQSPGPNWEVSRHEFNNTANFILPLEVCHHRIALTARIVREAPALSSPLFVKNAQFWTSTKPTLDLFLPYFTNKQTGTLVAPALTPSSAEVQEMMATLRNCLPVPGIKILTHPLEIEIAAPDPHIAHFLKAKLGNSRLPISSPFRENLKLVAIPSTAGSEYVIHCEIAASPGQQSASKGFPSGTSVVGTKIRGGSSYVVLLPRSHPHWSERQRTVAVHEILHQLGRDGHYSGTKCDRCSHQADRSIPAEKAYIDAHGTPLISASHARDSAIYGLDTWLRRVLPPTVPDLFDYCSDPRFGRWMPPHLYEDLLNRWRPVPVASSVPKLSDNSQPLAVRVAGRVDLEDGSMSWDFVDVSQRDSGRPSIVEAQSALQLIALDERNVTVGMAKLSTAWEEMGTAGTLSFWGEVTVDEPPNTLQLWWDDLLIGETRKSLVAPTIRDLAVAVPSHGNEFLKVFWRMEDADSSALETATEFSRDGGQTWTPLSFGVGHSSVAVDEKLLPGGQQLLIKVLVNDGFNHVSAISQRFSLNDKPPSVSVRFVNGSGEMIEGATALVLAANAYDVEDGSLDEKVLWTSDLQGTLGSGETLIISTNLLMEGRHLISAIVTDSLGQKAKDSLAVASWSANRPYLRVKEIRDTELILEASGDPDDKFFLEKTEDWLQWWPVLTEGQKWSQGVRVPRIPMKTEWFRLKGR